MVPPESAPFENQLMMDVRDSRRTRRPVPRLRPSFEAMEVRALLSAAPARRAIAIAARGEDAPGVAAVVEPLSRPTVEHAGVAARSAFRSKLIVEIQESRHALQALRARDLQGFRARLGTVLSENPPLWRAISASARRGSPAIWRALYINLRDRFPDVPPLASRPVSAPGAALPPPAGALPIGREFDISTRWVDINPPGGIPGGPQLAAMSSDSTVWVVGAPNQTGLYQYDPIGRDWNWINTLPGPAVSLTAGSVDSGVRRVWVAYQDRGTMRVARLTQPSMGGGVYYDLTTAPPNSGYVQLAAAPDGTLYALTDRGPFRFNGTWSGNSWTPVGTGGFDIGRIAVGSATNVWGIFSINVSPTIPSRAYRLVNGNWQAGPPLDNLQYVAPTGDGTVWAKTGDGGLYTLSPDGSRWLPVPNQLPPQGTLDFAAGTQYRAVSLSSTGGVQILTYGLADQPKTGYLLTPGQQLAYNYINRQLGITAAGGIRSLYKNLVGTQSLSDYFSEINTMARPNIAGMSPNDWTVVQNDLKQEIIAVQEVVAYFSQINNVNVQVNANATTQLGYVQSLVLLDSDQQQSTFDVVFEQIFDAALSGLVSALSGPGEVVASILASGISSAIDDLTSDSSPRQFATTYAALQGQLVQIASDSAKTNGDLLDAMLDDRNRYLPIAAGVANGTFTWNPGQTSTLVNGSLKGYEKYFLSVLAPVRYGVQILTNFPISEVDFQAGPSYARYYDYQGEQIGTMYMLAGGSFAFPRVPSKDLVDAITGITGLSLQQVLTGGLGWFQTWTLDYNDLYPGSEAAG